MAGFQPLGWGEMAHWAALTSVTVRPLEWRILRDMDAAFLDACREATRREQQASQSKHVHSDRPMTTELFDSIFQ